MVPYVSSRIVKNPAHTKFELIWDLPPILTAYADKAKLLLAIKLSDVLLRNSTVIGVGRIGRRIDYY
jgi:hypothetical protein